MKIILMFLFSYILGSVPTSYIFGKLIKGIDIRNHGSGNVGATNALRILGTKVGIITLLIDMGKGFLSVYLARLFIPEISNLLLVLAGLFAIIGHIFTIFLKFKGGKGVAASAGVFLALAPIPFILALSIFVITVWISKYVSLGSLLAAATLLIVEIVINIRNSFAELEILIFVFLIAAFIFIRHKANIKRLIHGNENKISFKK